MSFVYESYAAVIYNFYLIRVPKWHMLDARCFSSVLNKGEASTIVPKESLVRKNVLEFEISFRDLEILG